MTMHTHEWGEPCTAACPSHTTSERDSGYERARRQEEMVLALLGNDADKRGAYHHLPEFYHGINLLARALPKFVDFMHEEALAQDKRMKDAMRIAETMPPKPFFLPNDADLGPRSEDNGG
jgi:hypothetical protein